MIYFSLCFLTSPGIAVTLMFLKYFPNSSRKLIVVIGLEVDGEIVVLRKTEKYSSVRCFQNKLSIKIGI